MAGFNLADYQTVEERNAQFWARHPDGRIHTTLIFDDGQRFVFRCEVFTDRDDTRPAATGHAEEHVSGSGVNRTSALENCETSAEGRALARLGFAPKGARPSREEMAKAQRGQQAQRPTERRPSPATEAMKGDPKQARAQLAHMCEENGWDLGIVADRFAKEHGVSLGESKDAVAIAKFRTGLSGVPQAQLMAATNGAAR